MASYRPVLAACVLASLIGLARAAPGPGQPEALAGFDNRTNGLVAKAEFDKARDAFAESETVEEGLGPVYNAQSCGACHLNPVTGGISQITELRAGHLDGAGVFVPAPGGSLINDLAIDPTAQESVPDTEDIRTLRATLNTLGDGYVEAIDDDTLRKLAAEQASLTGGLIAGQVVEVSLLEDQWGTFAAPPALGDKIIHPFGDFLLHDIGTGDGIVQVRRQPTCSGRRRPGACERGRG